MSVGRNIFLFVGIGGTCGAIVRYSTSFIPFSEGFPFATLAVNLLGCFLLAFLLSSAAVKGMIPANFVTAIGTGFIGSFTTFSTFALETIVLSANHLFLAILYVFITIIGGLSLSYFGYRLAKGKQVKPQ